jgi:hypothetical protein
MTDQRSPGEDSDAPPIRPDPVGSGPPQEPQPAAAASPWQPAVVPPPIEESAATDATAAHSVSRDSGTFGATAGAGVAGRRTGLRWAIALGGVALVVAITAAVLALTSSSPNTSKVVGYMPNDTLIYAEYRLDLPGDQRAKLANFMSSFPGFKDTSSFDVKLDEALDQILAAATQNGQRWTTDIKPWFGGEIAVGNGPVKPMDATSFAAGPSGDSLVVVTITNRDGAIAWLTKTIPGLTQSSYNGATLLAGEATFGAPSTFAVTDSVILAGTDANVRAAVDSNGQNKLAEDPEFKAAFGTVKGDYVGFTFADYRTFLQSTFDLMRSTGGGLDTTTLDDEFVAMVPPWFGGSSRFEDDQLISDAVFPSIDFGFDAKNKRSTLVGHAPAGSIFYAESHDIGAALTALLERFRQVPDLAEAFRQFDQSAGMIGGLDGAIGWWGDVAVVISKAADGSIGGGVLIAPTDAEKAKRFTETLRSFIVLGGRGAGVEIRDIPHGNTTISVVDFSAAVGSGGGTLPPGVKAEVAFAVTPDVVVIGYGESFVREVLDANGASSLAGTQRYQDLVKRVGDENMGVTFVDITAIRKLVEPLVKDLVKPEDWAFYEREITPYLAPLDATVSSAVKKDGLDHLVQSIVVSKPAQ